MTLSQVYAALANYHANQLEIERELADELAEFDRLKQPYSGLVSPPMSQTFNAG